MVVVELNELDVDGQEVKEGIILIGKATKHNGEWRCLANAFGALVVVALTVKPILEEKC